MTDSSWRGFQRNLLAAPAFASGRVEIYSGVARMAQTVWASEVFADGTRPTAAFLFVHPTANMLGHYALRPVATRGFAGIGLTTRYAGNDSNLRTENCLLDIAAMVRHLRELGYEEIILVGNSGGASIAPYYQAQAENPTITNPPGGGPDLTQVDLPPVDGVVLFMAHSGRPRLICEWLDPAILDETNPLVRDPDLDMYNPHNGPPFSEEFVARYVAAQIARNKRITKWAEQMLRYVEANSANGVDDLSFVVHGTYADLRILDGTLDPSDRVLGNSLWGDPEVANSLPAGIGRYTTLRSWLNQWSIDYAEGDSLKWLPRVSVPVLICYGTGDTAAHPGHSLDMFAAAPAAHRTLIAITGAGHYFEGQQDLLSEAMDALTGWANDAVVGKSQI